MPRKRITKIMIRSDLPLRPNCIYPALVKDARKDGHAIHVILEHQDKENSKRTHDVILRLPARPTNLSGRYFAACLTEVKPGQEITLEDTCGCEVGVRFERTVGTDNYEVVDFVPLQMPPKKMPSDDS